MPVSLSRKVKMSLVCRYNKIASCFGLESTSKDLSEQVSSRRRSFATVRQETSESVDHIDV